MPWNVILLPLLGGFLFLDWCYYTRLRQQRLDGNRLLIESAFVAAILACIASIIVPALQHAREVVEFTTAHSRPLALLGVGLMSFTGWFYYRKFPSRDKAHFRERLFKSAVAGGSLPASGCVLIWLCHYPAQVDTAVRFWKTIAPFERSGTATIALALGILVAGLLNYLADYDGTAAFVAEQGGDYVLSLCFKAVQKEKPVTFILSNGRAYTGYIVLSPNLKSEGQVAMILAAHGSLPKESIRPKWEARYLAEWKDDPQKAEQFVVVFPARLIEHANIATKQLDESGTLTLAR